MKPTPWLETEDPLWSQQLTWNVGRNILINNFNDRCLTHERARQCPLIEEAVWFTNNVLEHPAHSREYLAENILQRRQSPSDCRALAFAALISHQDPVMMVQAAELGSPMAHYMMACNNIGRRQIDFWLDKALAGGYSEASAYKASMCEDVSDYQGEMYYLEQGILAASPACIMQYSTRERVPIVDRMYWSARAWAENIPRFGLFEGFCESWYNRCRPATYATETFIIGRVSYRHLRDATRMIEYPKPDNVSPIDRIKHAIELYQIMSDRTSDAIYSWSLAGKRLRVVKDIIGVISREIWQTRDQAEWLQDSPHDT
jgi:hypothetical protein